MSGDIDMSYYAIKNIPAAVDVGDPISKQVLENNYLNKNSYNTIFDLDVTKAYNAGDFILNGSRLQLIRNGQSILSQSKNSMRPEIGTSASGRYIGSMRGGVKCAMHWYVPRARDNNIHWFFVCVKLARVSGSDWDVLMSNDTGSYGLYIAYKGGNDTNLSFGGAYPRVQKITTLPGGTILFTKHMVSIHWQSSHVHTRFNGFALAPTYNTDVRSFGSSYGTIFTNWRVGSHGYKWHSNVQFYGMKIVAGYLNDAEITDMCNDMKTEYNIT